MCRNTFSRTCPESKPNTLYIGLKLCLSRDNLSPRVTIDVTIVGGGVVCEVIRKLGSGNGANEETSRG